MATVWWVLSFIGVAVVGMLMKEAHASLAIAARSIVNRAADRLPDRWREIRREEWLAVLDARDGMPIVKLLTSIGLFTSAIRSQLRDRLKRAAESAATSTADNERQQALLIFVLILIAAMAARADGERAELAR